ncbi:MAG: helicase-related protein [bacterium]|nr:helicase-related protein [bacterium]
MPHDIIDNQEQKLADHIGRLLDNSERAKFAVGYFFLSGFKAIRTHLETVGELRLLIGSTSNKDTVEALALSSDSIEVAAHKLEPLKYLTAQEKKEKVKEEEIKIARLAASLPQTDDDEEYIKHLVRLLKEGKIKVRVFTKGVLHAKAYIVDYPEGRYERGSAIVGSSNLSLSGISSNTELNVVVPGNENHEKLTAWFDKLWDDSEEFDKELMNVLESSWAIHEPTPYELYLKVVYELVRDRLDEDEKVYKPKGEAVPELYNYQRDAVVQARSILKEYQGVMLADVVGLGKTYMGAALLADHYARTGEKPLIICPPLLKPIWEKICDLHDLPAKVESRGKILDILEHDYMRNRPVILVDESHHFRHTNTKSYQALEEICHGKKVILLTATPYNTEAKDVLNQIRLFHPTDSTTIPVDPPNLRDYFKAVENGEKKLPDLLEHILVRRTRKHIEKYYQDDMKSGKLKFPKRKAPVRIDYSIDDVYPGIYDRIEKLLKQIRYARYDLYNYVKPIFREEADLEQLKVAGKNLVALIRTTLFKRLESSVQAFRKSVKDQSDIHELYLEHLRKGLVPAGLLAEELKRYQATGDSERLEDVLSTAADKYPAEKFEVSRLIEDIDKDQGVFFQIYELVKDLKPEHDAKLQRLLKQISEVPLKGSKVLIFTQFSTTAEYLGEHVAANFSQADFVTGSSHDALDKIQRFAPKANQAKYRGKDEIQILVTTDVLSEGVNLQDGNIVVNYDLHWNPVRLIQRIGRVDRVSTEHEEIHTYNFFPERKLETRLHLEERLVKRFEDIHKHIGLGEKYLSNEEKLSDIEMFKQMYTGGEIPEQDDEEGEISFAELVKMMRDLRKDKPELYKKIETLPDKMRSARSGSIDEIVGFFRANEYAALYLTDNEGKIVSRDMMDILVKLRCEPNEKRLGLPPGFNKKVSSLEKVFTDDAQERQAQLVSTSSEPIIKHILKLLNILTRKVSGSYKKKITDIREKLMSADLSPNEKRELRKIKNVVGTPEEKIDHLAQLLVAQQTLFHVKKKDVQPVSVQVIASEAFVKKQGM